jgi:polysaccharide deacetylase family protein (PEP-CTERM system associated)
MRNAITVDVEDYFHTEAMSAAAPREEWESMPSRVEPSTLRLLELFDRYGVKGTFFVLGWVAERFPGLVKEIAERGHELACHSHYHRAVFRLTPAEFDEDTRRAKQAIEDAGGMSIYGYRAPSFSMVPGTEWALNILANQGFTYDSSVNPIRHDFYSNAGAPRTPHRVCEGRMLELPIATRSALGQNLPMGGGAYLRVLPLAYSTWGLRSINAAGEPAMLYLHPWEIDAGQPRLKVGLKSRIRQYTNLDRMYGKLEHLLQNFKFGTVRDVFAITPSSPVIM